MKAMLMSVALISLVMSGVAAPVLTEKEAGKKVLLKCGDELIVRLSSNKTTGYGWEEKTFPEGILHAQGDSVYEQSPKAGKLVGAGGVEVWKFHAMNAGETSLVFSYARPWKKNIPPIRTVKWSVTVQPR